MTALPPSICQSNSTRLYVQPGVTVLSSNLNVTFVVFAVIIYALIIICVLVFALHRPYYDRLKVRQTMLVVLTATGVACQVSGGLVADASQVFFSQFPCVLRLIFFVLTPALVGGAALLRIVIFHFLANFSKLAMSIHRYDDGPDDEEVLETSSAVLVQSLISAMTAIRLGFVVFCVPIKNDKPTLRTLRFLISPKGQLLFVLVNAIPLIVLFLVIIFIVPEYAAGCNGCLAFPTIFVPFALVALVYFGLVFLAYFVVRNEPDTWDLGRETFLSLAAAGVGGLGFVLSFLVSSQFQPLESFGFFLVLVAQTIYPVVTARKIEGPRKFRRQLKKVDNNQNTEYASTALSQVATGNSGAILTLKQIVDSPVLCKAFENHLVAELGVESLLFLRDATLWKVQYVDVDVRIRTLRAKKIYRTFIDPDGDLTINIPSNQFEQLAKTVKGADNVTANAFDLAVKEMEHLLQTGAIMRFMNSQACKDIMDNEGGHHITSHASQLGVSAGV